ncbi:MAG: hypothetical protein FWG84_00975 [Bacteroidales bacterium]|nr:hypothetical protein [Bacteroidales bacterium]
MKKVILLLGCLGLLTVGILGVSCKKDDDKKDNFKGCSCTLRYADGDKSTEIITPADAQEFGITSCKKFQELWEATHGFEDEGIISYTCTDL